MSLIVLLKKCVARKEGDYPAWLKRETVFSPDSAADLQKLDLVEVLAALLRKERRRS